MLLPTAPTAPAAPRHYPKWKFHPEQPDGVVVKTAAEEQALSEGWYDSPAEFPPTGQPEPKTPKPAKAAAKNAPTAKE